MILNDLYTPTGVAVRREIMLFSGFFQEKVRFQVAF